MILKNTRLFYWLNGGSTFVACAFSSVDFFADYFLKVTSVSDEIVQCRWSRAFDSWASRVRGIAIWVSSSLTRYMICESRGVC